MGFNSVFKGLSEGTQIDAVKLVTAYIAAQPHKTANTKIVNTTIQIFF